MRDSKLEFNQSHKRENHITLPTAPHKSEVHEVMSRLVERKGNSMANYWFSFTKMVEILMMNIHSLKIQDWGMLKDSLRLMIPWMQLCNNNNYGKWLVEFWAEISTLTKSIDEHMAKSLFVQSLTGNPYSFLPLDIWIEMTKNKRSKMKAGWKNILKNEIMLLSHTHTLEIQISSTESESPCIN